MSKRSEFYARADVTLECSVFFGKASLHPWASTVAQWERICLQCRRHRRCRFSPWARKVAWRRKWQLQYFCLENSMHRRAWWAAVHGAAKSWTQLSDSAELSDSMHACMHTHTQRCISEHPRWCSGKERAFQCRRHGFHSMGGKYPLK